MTFQKDDPRAAAAGQKSGQVRRTRGPKRSLDYTKGYKAGWLAATLAQRPQKAGA